MSRANSIAQHAAVSRWRTIDPATGKPLSPEDAARARAMLACGRVIPQDDEAYGERCLTAEDRARRAAVGAAQDLAKRLSR